MRQQKGTTLVEMLIALAMLVIVLAAITALLRSTTRAYALNQELSEAHAQTETTRQQLRYDLSLAGYRGTDFSQFESNGFSGATASITQGTSPGESDAVTVRFFEDRYGAAGSSESVITLSVQNGELVRSVNGGPAEAVVAGLDTLKAAFIPTKAGVALASDNPPIGLSLTLTYADASAETLSVAFSNAQSSGITGPIVATN